MLNQRSHRILQQAHRENPDLERFILGVTADDKPLPQVRDLGSYLEHTVNGQIRTFHSCAITFERWVRRLRWMIEILGLVSVVLSAAGALLGGRGWRPGCR